MKTKVNKLVRYAAVGLFLIALAVNVKVTLDDPFVMLSEQAIATGSNDVTSTTSYTCYSSITTKEASKIFYCGTCDWVNNSTDRWYSQSSICTK